MIGKEIFCIPKGNAIGRNIPLVEQIATFTVSKVGNKRIVTKLEAFYIDGSLDRHNFGYLPFLTRQCVLDYLDIEQFRYDIKK